MSEAPALSEAEGKNLSVQEARFFVALPAGSIGRRQKRGGTRTRSGGGGGPLPFDSAQGLLRMTGEEVVSLVAQ